MIWAPVPEWGRYEVSDTGIVRSTDMIVQAKNKSKAVRKGRVLSQAVSSNGYFVVTLTNGAIRKQEFVHRLVALAFIGPPPHFGAHILHCDGDPKNNTLKNLRWGTPAENHADTERHGRRRKHENHPSAKLTRAAVHDIRTSNLKSGVLAEKYGVTRAHIWAVRRNRVWR